MRHLLALAVAGAVSLGFGLPAFAHHSGSAEFDLHKKIDISGTVTKVEWTNPHAHFYLDVKDSKGAVTHWNLELASPNVLMRNGWRRNSLKAGDTVTVTGLRAKDRNNFASASVITFPDGHKLTFLAADDYTR